MVKRGMLVLEQYLLPTLSTINRMYFIRLSTLRHFKLLDDWLHSSTQTLPPSDATSDHAMPPPRMLATSYKLADIHLGINFLDHVRKV